MSESLESLRKKMAGAGDLGSVVRTMKVMAASNIGQYEMATRSLATYYHTVELGILAYFYHEKIAALNGAVPNGTVTKEIEPHEKKKRPACIIVFGSDQGLVGRFNDSLADFILLSLEKIPGPKIIWAAGERLFLRLADMGLDTAKLLPVPNSVSAITSLVGQMLVMSEESREKNEIEECYIFHNRPKPGSGYEPTMKRFLPLDKRWRQDLSELKWPENNLPQVIGVPSQTLSALIREYLFVSLYKACAESLASENASRLNAMQRAEKNIDELLANLNLTYNRLRQSTIDEELFDITSGFAALQNWPAQYDDNQ